MNLTTPSLKSDAAGANPASARFGVALSALTLSLFCATAAAQNDNSGTYLEALGSSLSMADVDDVGQNPFDAEQGDKKATDPAAQRLTHDGNVLHHSNVPAPGRPGQNRAQTMQVPAQPTAQVSSGSPAPAPGYETVSASGVTGVEPLPDPRVGQYSGLVDIPQEVLNRLAPADAAQLRLILRQLHERQGAAVTPPNAGYTSRASQYTVDLSPGATPPVIRVARGVGATVNFVDAGGNPWPIEFANNFHSEAATITQMAPHVLSVSANSPHLTGSVGVMLKNLTTPVNFIVTPAQTSTDYRVDLLVPGFSPEAVPQVGAVQSRPGVAKGGLMDYLYGATPDGSKRLKITGNGIADSNTRAWQDAEGNLVLRTSAQVVSPGWYDMLPALDGTSVYRLSAAPVVRVSVNGKIQSFTIEGLSPRVGQVAKK